VNFQAWFWRWRTHFGNSVQVTKIWTKQLSLTYQKIRKAIFFVFELFFKMCKNCRFDPYWRPLLVTKNTFFLWSIWSYLHNRFFYEVAKFQINMIGSSGDNNNSVEVARRTDRHYGYHARVYNPNTWAKISLYRYSRNKLYLGLAQYSDDILFML